MMLDYNGVAECAEDYYDTPLQISPFRSSFDT